MPDPLDDLLGMPPLDLGETMTMGQPPPPSAPSASAQAKSFAPLLALLPIVAAKGGRVGIASLLHGFQQARARNQQAERQAQLDAEAQRRQSEAERIRRATLAQTTANNEAQRRQQVLTNFQSGLEGLDNEEAVRAYLQLYGQQAQSVGLRPEVLEGFAMEAVKPSRLQKKEAEKVIESAKRQYGEQAVSHTYTLKDGTQANWEELNRRAGVMLGAQALTPNLEGNTPEKLHLIAYAKERGKTPEQLTPKEIEAARKSFQQSDDRPQPQATILIQTVDENGNPIQQLVPRTPGITFAKPPTAGQQTAMAEQEAGIAMIGDIERLYKPEYVGPVVGRMTQAQMAIPGAPDVSLDVARFYAATAALRNEIIRLMSGAAVSGSEEQRMRSQIPDVTDKPSVFIAKLNQTKRNRETLLQRLQARSGQPQSAAPTPWIDAGGGFRVREKAQP
jgi:hypothetical protein